MGPLEYLFGQIENARGQIKRRGLLDLPNILGEELGRRASRGLLASDQMASVVPEVKEAGRKAMTEQGLGLLGAIKAYHGSPHKFDKFDMSKIGTGEGAQAYGHGLYFAENPGVANYYKVAEENVFPTIRKDDSRFDIALRESTDVADNKIYAAIRQNVKRSTVLNDNTLAQVKKQIQHDADYFAGSPAGAAADAALKKFDGIAARLKGAQFDYDPGHMYEVSLRWPDPAREARDPLGPQHFLDWDKPISEQSDLVRNALNVVGENPTGGQFVNNLGLATSRDKAAKVLRGAGIPGIRYLDAGSRGTGGGTANYVMFDDALVEILKRNGLAP